MNKKEKCKKMYRLLVGAKAIKEHSLNLMCSRDSKNGRYYMFDDYTNPIFRKGHKSPMGAWKATEEWLEKEIFRSKILGR